MMILYQVRQALLLRLKVDVYEPASAAPQRTLGQFALLVGLQQ
jgi:hypothetical protein